VWSATEAKEANAAVASTIGLMTGLGDLLIGAGSHATNRLAVGADGTFLKSNGAVPTWASIGAGSVVDVGGAALYDPHSEFPVAPDLLSLMIVGDTNVTFNGAGDGTLTLPGSFTRGVAVAMLTIVEPPYVVAAGSATLSAVNLSTYKDDLTVFTGTASVRGQVWGW
jgi:hypothetical protein